MPKYEEYNPEENEKLSQRIREPLQRRKAEYHETYGIISPQEKRKLQKQERRERFIQGTKKSLGAAEREATGFIRDIRREGIRSGYKTQRTMQQYNPLRQTRRVRRLPSIVRGTRRTMTYEGPGLGERAIQEMSGGQHILDRDFFGSGEQRELIGQTAHDLTLGQKDKKQIKYY